MRLGFVMLLAALLPLGLRAETPAVRLTASPAEFPADGETVVSITLTKEPGADGIRLPKAEGVVWHTERRRRAESLRIVNGRRTHSITLSLPLSAEKPGEVVIPPLEVRFADGTTARSKPLKLKVLPPGEAPKGPAGPAGRIELPADRKRFYVGEEIPVAFVLSLPATLRLTELDYPRLKCDGPVVMPDLSGRRTRHPHFLDPTEDVAETPEGARRVLAFRTRLRFMAPGSFTVTATEQLAAAEPRRNTAFDDDFEPFFSGRFFTGESRRFQVKYPALKLEVAPVPPVPQGTFPLGMGATPRLEATLSGTTAQVGEPVELRLTPGGAAEPAGFDPPALTFPGFRVYKPETKRAPDGTRSIRYALVPLRPGEHEIAATFALFDPETGKWRSFPYSFPLAVTGKAALPAATAPAPPQVKDAPAAPGARFVPLPEPGGEVTTTPVRTGLVRGGVACGVLALAALAVELWRRRRGRRDPAELARRHAVAELVRRTKRGDDLDAVLSEGGRAALARTFDLPEDAPAELLASRVGDAELGEVLNHLEHNAFAPEAERKTPVVSAAARRKLVKLLKRSLAVALLVFATNVMGAGIDPVRCYNLGVEARRDGDLPRARLLLERAHRLAPRDARFRDACSAVEAELGVKGVGSSLRDRFRPDEYLTTAGLLLGLGVLAFSMLRKRRRRTAFVVAWTLVALGAVAAALAWGQCSDAGLYHPGRAVVTEKRLELFTLPVENGGRSAGTLPGGTVVTVVEERGNHLHIRGGGADGWCRRSGVEKVFP